MGGTMRRGEVRWYTFREPDKRRPVLILTRESAISYLNALTVAPITTTIRHIPSEVYLSPDDGLLTECVANLDNIQTVPKRKPHACFTPISGTNDGVESSHCFRLGYPSSWITAQPWRFLGVFAKSACDACPMDIQSLLWRGKPYQCLLRAWSGVVQLAHCQAMVAELSEAASCARFLGEPHSFRPIRAAEYVRSGGEYGKPPRGR